MQIRFKLTPREWSEARRLRKESGKPPRISVFVWVAILVPMTASIGDLYQELKHSRGGPFHGTILPVVLAMIAIVTAALVLEYRRKNGGFENYPKGETEFIFTEEGFLRRQWVADNVRMLLPLMQSWSEISEFRVGTHVIVLFHGYDRGYEVLPLRSLTSDQVGTLKRMLGRKVRAQRVTSLHNW